MFQYGKLKNSVTFRRRRLRREFDSLGPHSTDRQRTLAKERSNALLRKIQTWCRIQQSYMPGAIVLRDRFASAPPVDATREGAEPCNVPLYLPSADVHRSTCDDKLRRHELSLQIAQANDALNDIRHNLRLRSHLYKFKDRFARGQAANTRSRGIISRIQGRIDAAADTYDVARKAVQSLSSVLNESGWEGQLKVLNRNEDLRGLSEAGYDNSEDKQGHISGGKRKHVSQGRRKLSWIWLTTGIELDADGKPGDRGLHECEHHVVFANGAV
jgi:hypothetical protein